MGRTVVAGHPGAGRNHYRHLDHLWLPALSPAIVGTIRRPVPRIQATARPFTLAGARVPGGSRCYSDGFAGPHGQGHGNTRGISRGPNIPELVFSGRTRGSLAVEVIGDRRSGRTSTRERCSTRCLCV